jgi:hypothetical protein
MRGSYAVPPPAMLPAKRQCSMPAAAKYNPKCGLTRRRYAGIVAAFAAACALEDGRYNAVAGLLQKV